MKHANDNRRIPAQIRLWLSVNPQIARQHYRDSLKRLNEILKSL